MLQAKQILFIGTNGKSICQDLIANGYVGLSFASLCLAEAWITHQLTHKKRLPDIIFCDAELEDGDAFALYEVLKKHKLQHGVPYVILSSNDDPGLRERAHQLGIDDIFQLPADAKDIYYRLHYISTTKALVNHLHPNPAHSPAIPVLKRLFDVLASAAAILALSPVMLLIAVLIKLDSKGPVLYVSRRAGYNYRIFNFYKFRSMRVKADEELQLLMDRNQYKNSSFLKIRNDPRITRLGAFLRNTSLDELPQLFNVLKGDMSLIGNRPLPLYEAESLTTDEWALRFMAPAGITGLWQVTKRGQDAMTDLERKNLDIQYAVEHSAKLDYQIFMKTFSALRQKETV